VVARRLGIPVAPSAVQSMVIPIDVLVIPDVLPFWRAVLGHQRRDHLAERRLRRQDW
jgi:4a-hydroxytetrahydrobiopterin dehydratase